MRENQRKSETCCVFSPTPNERGRWRGRRQTKSYYVAGIIPIQIDKVSVKQISINPSVFGKEEIITTVSVKMRFWKDITL